MKALVVGNSHAREALRPILDAAGIGMIEDHTRPDIVICHGGDGTLIGAERDFPLIPKLPVRPDSKYEKCPRHQTVDLLRRVASGNATPSRLPKLQARFGQTQLLAVNDVVIHNAKVTSAVRYRVSIDGVPYSSQIVGDGMVVSTPFGSTAYYRSITNSVFRVGMGLAFNNSTESVNHLVLSDGAVIDVVISRGPALLVADNVCAPLPLDVDDHVVICKGTEEAEILELESLTCMECRERATGRPAGHLHVH